MAPTPTATVFTREHSANRGTSSYQADGYSGTIYLSRNAFNGVHPDSIQVLGVPKGVPKASSMTPDERKAAAKAKREELAKLSPAERAQKKLDAAQKALDAAKQKAAKASETTVPATTAAAAGKAKK